MNLRRREREARAPRRPAWRQQPQSVSMCVLQELVEYYQYHSLKESFKQLDTTLKYPYKSRERATSRASSRSPGNAPDHPACQGSPSQFPGPHCPGEGLSVGHTHLGQQPVPEYCPGRGGPGTPLPITRTLSSWGAVVVSGDR